MLTICFDHIVETLESGKQCMVFVHSRNETFTTASRIVEMINRSEKSDLFQPDLAQVKRFSSQLMRRNNLKLLSDYSISIHHAGDLTYLVIPTHLYS